VVGVGLLAVVHGVVAFVALRLSRRPEHDPLAAGIGWASALWCFLYGWQVILSFSAAYFGLRFAHRPWLSFVHGLLHQVIPWAAAFVLLVAVLQRKSRVD